MNENKYKPMPIWYKLAVSVSIAIVAISGISNPLFTPWERIIFELALVLTLVLVWIFEKHRTFATITGTCIIIVFYGFNVMQWMKGNHSPSLVVYFVGIPLLLLMFWGVQPYRAMHAKRNKNNVSK